MAHCNRSIAGNGRCVWSASAAVISKEAPVAMAMDGAPPLGLASIVVIEAGNGILSLLHGGEMVTFDQHSVFELGSMEVAILPDVFRLGDVLSILGVQALIMQCAIISISMLRTWAGFVQVQ